MRKAPVRLSWTFCQADMLPARAHMCRCICRALEKRSRDACMRRVAMPSLRWERATAREVMWPCTSAAVVSSSLAPNHRRSCNRSQLGQRPSPAPSHQQQLPAANCGSRRRQDMLDALGDTCQFLRGEWAAPSAMLVTRCATLLLVEFVQRFILRIYCCTACTARKEGEGGEGEGGSSAAGHSHLRKHVADDFAIVVLRHVQQLGPRQNVIEVVLHRGGGSGIQSGQPPHWIRLGASPRHMRARYEVRAQ